MASIIDELYLLVGLDARKFDAGRRDVASGFKQLTDTVSGVGKTIDAAGTKISEVFGFMKRGVLGFLGAFVGDEAAQFINRIGTMDAAMGRLAKTTGSNVEDIARWSGAVRMMGGSTEEVQSSMLAISDMIGKAHSMMLPGAQTMGLLSQLGININQTKDANEFLNKLFDSVERFKKAGMSDQDIAARIRSALPISETMIYMLLQGKDKLKDYEEQLSHVGLTTKEAADIAQDYQGKIVFLEIAFERLAAKAIPYIVAVLDWARKLFDAHPAPDSFMGKLMSGAEKFEKAWGGGDVYLDWSTGLPHWKKQVTEDIARGGNRYGVGRFHPKHQDTPHTSDDVSTKPGSGIQSEAIHALAASLQGGVPGLDRFTSFADPFHSGFPSAHSSGRALDFTIKDPKQAAAIAQQVRDKLREMGVNATVLDEYSSKSAHWTAPHIHVQFNNADAARRYLSLMGSPGGAGMGLSRTGQPTGGGSTSTTSIHVSQLTIQVPNGDPTTIAQGVVPALQRLAMGTPADYSITG